MGLDGSGVFFAALMSPIVSKEGGRALGTMIPLPGALPLEV